MRAVLRIAAIGLALTLGPSLARADLPPPDGFKFVGFSLSVGNTKSFPDYVFLAYPASMSNGAPVDAYGQISDGSPIELGRRGGIPQIYAMKRADYESWKASYHPTQQSSDPALSELFKSNRVTRCTGPEVTPTFQIPKSDPRTSVTQTLKVDAADAKGCRLSAVADSKPVEPAPKTTPANVPPTTGSDPKQSAPTAPPHGCGGCTLASPPASSLVLGSLLAFAGALIRRARRSKARG